MFGSGQKFYENRMAFSDCKEQTEILGDWIFVISATFNSLLGGRDARTAFNIYRNKYKK